MQANHGGIKGKLPGGTEANKDRGEDEDEREDGNDEEQSVVEDETTVSSFLTKFGCLYSWFIFFIFCEKLSCYRKLLNFCEAVCNGL